jgi:hypothetical protein
VEAPPAAEELTVMVEVHLEELLPYTDDAAADEETAPALEPAGAE